MGSNIKVGINGFGRIGRIATRIAEQEEGIEVVGINGRTSPESHANLFKKDSAYGQYQGKITHDVNEIIINDRKIKVFTENTPDTIDWESVGADVVIETTGKFTSKETAGGHLKGGAKKVLIGAPGKNIDATFVKGVNEHEYDSEKHTIVSNASCTTTCLATIAKILDETYQIIAGDMTTIHAVTGDQNIIDGSHKDPRRARAAYESIVPTSTGAAKAIGEVLPNLKGKLNGLAMRVPILTGSVIVFNVNTIKKATKEEINEFFKNNTSQYLEYNDEALVSIDIKANPHSAIFDPTMTSVAPDGMMRVGAWYDNEWGYSQRLVEMARYIGEKIKASS